MKEVGIAFGVICLSIFIFFHAFIFLGKLPLPSDTIIGLYHPYRDLYAKDYPNGIPYKNFLITDPVRQQYPWRKLVTEQFQNWQLPLWNPYNFSGAPLLAGMQAAPLYPGNILFFFIPFSYAWSILIVSQPFLAALFFYIYLRNLRISHQGSLLGSITFAFCGFFIAWLEWGTVLHVALWLPLILYSIDGIFLYASKNKKGIYNDKITSNALLLLGSVCFAFFAGHLQTFFYLAVFTVLYTCARFIYYGKNMFHLIPLGIISLLFLGITFIQWYPLLQLIGESARVVDQEWTKVGWFIPWQHIIQFIAPDFFGNPASLNYWSEWNYAEFIGYVGILPLLFATFALCFRRDKKTVFFAATLGVSLLFAFPTPLAHLPYQLSLPFISTAQPTRLLFLVDFSLAVLAAAGFDTFLKQKKQLMYPLVGISSVFILVWVGIILGTSFFPTVTTENFAIAKRNLIFPTLVLALCWGVYFFSLSYKKHYALSILTALCIGITLFDLLRFGMKFTPFTDQAYLFPQTKSIAFLQNQKQNDFRIMTTDAKMLPPNFSAIYHIQSVDGYDPLYLRRYAELIAASERKKPDITPPFGFNRIITPHNYESSIMDLLGVKYVLSLSDIESNKLKKVFQEGHTRIYENTKVYPRAFFVSSVTKLDSKEAVIKSMFDTRHDLKKQAFTDDSNYNKKNKNYSQGNAKITSYSDNGILVEVNNNGDGFLVITDIYYPIWKAVIYEGVQSKQLPIIRTNYTFRGIEVPKGNYTIHLYTTLL